MLCKKAYFPFLRVCGDFHPPVFLRCHSRMLPEIFVEKRQVVKA